MPAAKSHIVLIGAGNIASHLLDAWKGQAITLFNHRRSKRLSELAKKYRVPVCTSYALLPADADVYIICVKDEAIADVAKQLNGLNLKGLVAHTSGSVDMAVLKGAAPAYGVFYPLQTFSAGQRVDWKQIPVLVEGNNTRTTNTLKKLAATLSKRVVACRSGERLKLHLAAVMAGNFSNALYALTDAYVSEELGAGYFDLLKPLIVQTALKTEKLSPRDAQTGPARRHDTATIKKHLALLRDHPQVRKIYRLMTQLIQQQQA